MVSPDKNIVNLFSQCIHCDDMTNSYQINLIEKDDVNALIYYQLHTKLISKLTHKKFGADFKEILWPYGVASTLSLPKKLWFKLNIMLVNYIRYRKTR